MKILMDTDSTPHPLCTSRYVEKKYICLPDSFFIESQIFPKPSRSYANICNDRTVQSYLVLAWFNRLEIHL